MIPNPDPALFTIEQAVYAAVQITNDVGAVVLYIIGLGIGTVIAGLLIRAIREALRDAI